MQRISRAAQFPGSRAWYHRLACLRHATLEGPAVFKHEASPPGPRRPTTRSSPTNLAEPSPGLYLEAALCVGTHMAWHLLAIAVASLPLLASLRASLPFPSRELRGGSRPGETPLAALFAEVLRKSVLGNLRACFAKFRVTCGGAVSHLPERQQGHRRRRRLSSRRGRGPGRRWSPPSLLRVSMRATPSASRSVRSD